MRHYFAIVCFFAGTTALRAQGPDTFVSHVSSHRTLEDALSSYDALKLRVPALAANKPFVHKVDLGRKGVWFRLRIGPLMSEAAARALCVTIKAAKEPYCVASEAFDLAQMKPGYFGEVLLKPLDDGRMEVRKPFGFVDSQARRWEVPAGAITDGASIPRVFWSIIGSPFTGKYLKAAIIHDHYAQTKYRSWPVTHDNFYETMIASGVPKESALVMWAAVYRFGPRWAEDETYCADSCAGGNIFIDHLEIEPQYVEKEFLSIKDYIAGNPQATRKDVEKFIVDNTYFPDGAEDSFLPPYPARVRGYVSSGFSDDPQAQLENLKQENRGGEGWAEGPDQRRYVDGAGTMRWPSYGTRRGEPGDDEYALILYKVIDVPKGDTLKVHAGPMASSPVVGEFPHDAKGIELRRHCNDRWCFVKQGDVRGYVSTRYLTFGSGRYDRRPEPAPPTTPVPLGDVNGVIIDTTTGTAP